jgi:hypothetical protein
LIGGPNEQRVVELFAAYRRSIGEGEPGDENPLFHKEEDDDDDYIPKRQYAYPREHKLAAIEYFQNTWIKKEDDTFEQIPSHKAS